MRTVSLLVALLLAVPASARMVSVSVPTAILREGPGAGYPVLGQADRLTPFRMVGWSEGWARVRDMNAREGWLHESTFTAKPAVAVKSKRAYVRQGPGRRYRAVWRVSYGYPLEVRRREGRWLKVANGKIAGWISETVVWGAVQEEDPELRS